MIGLSIKEGRADSLGTMVVFTRKDAHRIGRGLPVDEGDRSATDADRGGNIGPAGGGLGNGRVEDDWFEAVEEVRLTPMGRLVACINGGNGSGRERESTLTRDFRVTGMLYALWALSFGRLG